MNRKQQIILIACITLLVSSINNSTRAEEKSKPETAKLVRVAIFDFSKSKASGPGNLMKFLTPAYGFQSTVVSPDEIRAGVLKDFDVVIFPGGSGSRQAKELKEEGRTAVRKFVRAGGGYVGICAGAYLASSHYQWSLGVINARVWDRQHWARGKKQVDISLTPSGCEVLSKSKDKYTVHYQNGPLLVPDNQPHLPGYEVLAKYDTEVARNGASANAMIGTHAIIRSKFGTGRVICFSPHPEKQDGPKSLMASGVYWAANAD